MYARQLLSCLIHSVAKATILRTNNSRLLT